MSRRLIVIHLTMLNVNILQSTKQVTLIIISTRLIGRGNYEGSEFLVNWQVLRGWNPHTMTMLQSLF